MVSFDYELYMVENNSIYIIRTWCITEHEIRTEKCSDTCQHKIKFVLTFSRNDQTLIEICDIVLYVGSDICQINQYQYAILVLSVIGKKCNKNRQYIIPCNIALITIV